MKKFGDLHEDYRKKRNLSRDEMAKHIKKHQSYIRRIEIQNYVPPFEICEKLATKMNLTQSEKQNLYTVAFLSRIGKNNAFYNELLSDPQPLNATSKTPPKKPSQIPEIPFKKSIDSKTEYRCLYAISWYTKNKQNSLTDSISETVRNFLMRTLSDLELECHDLNIHPTQVSIVLEIPPSYKVEELITNIKSLSSAFIHTKFPKIDHSPNIWSQETSIATLGTNPYTAPTKKRLDTVASTVKA